MDSLVSTGQGYIGWNMFAYCNNPVMYHEPGGYRFEANQFGPNAMAYESAGSHKLGSQFVSNLNTKCKKTINAIVKNCEVSAGVGLGLYLGFDVLSIASGDIGTYYDLVHVEYSGGNWSASQYYFTGIEGQFAKVYLFEHTENESCYRAIDGSGGWKEEDSVGMPTIPLGGASFYFFGGGSFSFAYDFEGLWNDISSIWGIKGD